MSSSMSANTPVSFPNHYKPDSAKLLEILTTTLKESWGILLYVEWPHNYGLQLGVLDEHWRNHGSTIQEFLKEHHDSDNSFVGDYQVGALTLLHDMLLRELRFQSKLQQDVHSMLEESWDEGDVRGPLTALLAYLHINQAALSERFEYVSSELTIANDRTKHLVPISKEPGQPAAA